MEPLFRKPLSTKNSDSESNNPFQVPQRKHSLPSPTDNVQQENVQNENDFATPMKKDLAPQSKTTMTRPTGSPVTPFPMKKSVSFHSNASYGMSALLNSSIYDEPVEKLENQIDHLTIQKRKDSIGEKVYTLVAEDSAHSPTENRAADASMSKTKVIRGNASNALVNNNADAAVAQLSEQLVQERKQRDHIEKLYSLQQKQLVVLENSVQSLNSKLVDMQEKFCQSHMDARAAKLELSDREKLLTEEIDRLRKRNTKLTQELDESESRYRHQLENEANLTQSSKSKEWDLQLMTTLLKRNEIQLVEMKQLLAHMEDGKEPETSAQLSARLKQFLKDSEPGLQPIIERQKQQIKELQGILAKNNIQVQLSSLNQELIRESKKEADSVHDAIADFQKSKARLF